MAFSLNLNWPGWTWLAHTGENAAVAFCATLAAAFAGQGVTGISGINWPDALDIAAYAALGVILAAVIALRVKNGTASFNPNVVAKAADANQSGG